MAITRPMYREDHDQPRGENIMAGEDTGNGRVSTLVNQALKLTYIIDEQVTVISERLQPITRPSMPEAVDGMMTAERDEPERRDSPMAEQINILIHRLQRLQSRLNEIPERLDV